ncbi:MAG: exo-beta-N-acetylmuramidase NamZ family protein, partial [Planctomycetota bacterium]
MRMQSGLLTLVFWCTAVLPCFAQDAPVRLGIDRLVEDDFATVTSEKMGRLGLITNHTGLDSRGRRTVDLLHHAPHVKLTALFSPEHGLYGVLDQSNIDNAVDPKTGLRVWSLYGATRKPTAKMLADVDTLVFEIQDIGTRFYTYIATMGHAMEAAAEHGKKFVVLDRPNPIGGLKVDGPLPDVDDLSFVAYREIPVVHGMTIGELAVMFNERWQIGCDLTVVRMSGWRRGMQWEDTGVTWVNPSPNMRSPEEARLYPAIGLMEFTNVSVGRGTAIPFEHFGAPWIDGKELA